MANKTCSKCGEEKPFTPEYFHRDKAIATGLCPQCKTCRNRRNMELGNCGGNPESKAAYKLTAKGRVVQRRYRLKKEFSLSLEQYQQMLDDQGGACKICCWPERRKRKSGEVKDLAVDHCHETGEIRGLLCAACNTSIGLMQDDTPRIENSVRYLKGEL